MRVGSEVDAEQVHVKTRVKGGGGLPAGLSISAARQAAL